MVERQHLYWQRLIHNAPDRNWATISRDRNVSGQADNGVAAEPGGGGADRGREPVAGCAIDEVPLCVLVAGEHPVRQERLAIPDRPQQVTAADRIALSQRGAVRRERGAPGRIALRAPHPGGELYGPHDRLRRARRDGDQELPDLPVGDRLRVLRHRVHVPVGNEVLRRLDGGPGHSHELPEVRRRFVGHVPGALPPLRLLAGLPPLQEGFHSNVRGYERWHLDPVGMQEEVDCSLASP